MSTAPASTTRQETAGQTETSNDSLLAPGNEEHVPLSAEAEVEVLEAFLREEFPEEFKRTNRQVPESPVEIAIRMLQALHAHKAAGAPDVRCDQEFCNKPNGHTDSHGWVHFG